MRTTAKTESAQAKKRIQELLRQIGLARQDGKCFFTGLEVNGKYHECSGWIPDKNDDHSWRLVYQYDHLNPRERSVSYGDSRLGVVICKGLHGWKSFSDTNKKIYDKAAKRYLPKDIVKLWEMVEADTKSYPMDSYEWMKVEASLKAELKELQGI